MDDGRLYPINTVLLSGDEVTADTSSRLLEDARGYFAKGFFRETVIACAAQLELNPDDAEALRLSAKANLALKNMSAAVTDLTALCRVLPMDAAAQHDLAKAYGRMGEYEKSLPAFHRALELHPARHDAWLGLGRARMKLGQPEEAVEPIRTYLAAKPDDDAARVDLLTVLVNSKRFAEAVIVGREAMERGISHPSAHRGLAKALRGVNAADDAITYFTLYAEAKPEDAAGHHDLGRTLHSVRRHDEAEQALRRALECAPDRVSARLDLANALAALNRLDEAEAIYLALTEFPATAVASQLELARLRLRQNRPRLALKGLRAAVAKTPNELKLYTEMAQLHLQLGQFNAGDTVLKKAVKRGDGEPGVTFNHGRFHLMARRYASALAIFRKVEKVAPTYPGLQRSMATCLFNMGEVDKAETILRAAIAHDPGDAAAYVGLGRLLNRQKRYEDAIRMFAEALVLSPRDINAEHGLGVAYRRSGALEKALAHFTTALAIDPRHVTTLFQFAELANLAGNLDEVNHYTSRILEIESDHANALMLRAQVAFEKGQPAAALADLDLILAIDKTHKKAALLQDLIRHELADSGGAASISLCLVDPHAAADRKALRALAPAVAGAEEIAASGTAPHWTRQILASAADWVLVAPEGVPTPAERDALCGRSGPMVGAVVQRAQSPETGPSLWRRETLVAWLRMARPEPADWASCATALAERLRIREVTEAADFASAYTRPPRPGRPVAWLVSSSGINVFGGVERFLRSMAPIYTELGYDAVIVGLLESLDPNKLEGEVDGLKYLNIERTVEAVREAGLRYRPDVVQCTTGVGYEVVHGLEGQTARIIYGSHFWRDMFVGADSFENVDRDGRPRAEFKRLCATIDHGYANSVYTQEIIRRFFGVIQPLIYSLPFDEPSGRSSPEDGSYILLMNGRPDKGFTLLLDLARRVPEARFKAVASQVSAERIIELVRQSGLDNIEITGWTDDTASLYRGARAVMVASYAFVETFSRVTIEAHRFGVPVIGSDRGNVPLLLKDSGVILPEDAALWAAEIRRLYHDRAYYAERCRRATENSASYKFADQSARVSRILRAVDDRIAVAVGSGIGNMIQCSPAIRRISEHFRKPVDILMNQDFPGCGRLFADSPYVGQVFEDTSLATKLNYRAILVLDCFGDLIPHFNSDMVFVTRRRFPFSMTRDIHEAEFNLLCAKAFLGVPYERADAAGYFVGAMTRGAVKNGRIGIHAGGKAGVWTSKRWPYYAELVRRLIGRGYEVVSFGSAEEYVEGTVDLTGTDLATSLANINTCAYFIANDSGLMHVADALGIPVAAVFGPTSVKKNGPLSGTSLTIAIEKDCAPCQFDPERFLTCRCIQELHIDDVDGRISAHMDQTGVGAPTTLAA
jgi:tetratricopeptide (TPR) repeat protein/ADP-heptose:LPS heptosyltransferase/glycosyltransferase involved in cell wall biosynthesis